MKARMRIENSVLKGLSLDITFAEWLVISKALKQYRMDLDTPNADAIIADDLIDTVTAELREIVNG